MNYRLHYGRLIVRAQGRTLAGYVERHHVLPRCMGGSDALENIVALTPEEHYVAHQLLVKMHPGEKSLVHAVLYMAKQCSGNKAFGWLRRRKAEAMLGHKINLGIVRSAESRAKQSASARGRKRPPFSAQHRERLGAAMRGNKFCLGRKLSAESRAKMSASAKGRVFPRAVLEKAANTTRLRWQRYRESKAVQ